jgi:voltage-gated potassium channel Kch
LAYPGNVRKARDRLVAPIDNAPITSRLQILANALECLIMLEGRRSRKSRQKGDSIADVGAAEHIGIDKFTKDLPIREASLLLKIGSFGGILCRATDALEASGHLRGHGHDVMTVTFTGRWVVPAMGLKEMVDICLTI